MRQFPPSADLQFLLGETFGQIALDPYSIQFRFAAGGQITVEWQIEHVDAAGTTHPHDCQNPAGHAVYLHQLLQHPIIAVDAKPLCLSLTFATRAILRIFTEVGDFECGQICSDRGVIVF